MDNVIHLENLTKVFRKFPRKSKVVAVDNLSLSVKKGEIFGILGPNGSGKTTTLSMLLGMVRPTSGTILIMDGKPGSLKVKENVGFLPESSYLYSFLSGKETLEYYGRLANLKKSEIRRRVMEVLKTVGLSDASKRLVKEYSKGMQRRLQLAQVLLKDPPVFFMDEPTIGLDPIGSKEMKDIILDIKKKGKTIVLSSHLLSEVESVCDRICILCDGKKIQEGYLNEILETSNEYQFITSDVNTTVKNELKKFLEDRKIKLIKEGHPKKRLDKLFVEEVEKKRNEKN